MVISFLDSVTFSSAVQLPKDAAPTWVTVLGITISFSDVQSLNAQSLIDTVEEDSCTFFRFVQFWKALLFTDVTESGITTVSIPGQFANKPLATMVVPSSNTISFKLSHP